MAIQPKRFHGLRSLTAWEHVQAWRQQRRAMMQRFLDDNAGIINALASASSKQISGSANLAAEAAVKRIRAAATAKLDKTA